MKTVKNMLIVFKAIRTFTFGISAIALKPLDLVLLSGSEFFLLITA